MERCIVRGQPLYCILHNASRGLSVIAEFLVSTISRNCYYTLASRQYAFKINLSLQQIYINGKLRLKTAYCLGCRQPAV